MNFWIIIPVHNRKTTTAKCLRLLKDQGVMNTMRVCVIDDGSTDGTSNLLKEHYPDVVTLQGNGNLYWGGAIQQGMKSALASGAEVVIWLNDDCYPDPHSLDKICNRVMETKGICGGICYDISREKVTYSGHSIFKKTAIELRPTHSQILPADILNGNIVAIHKNAINQIGVLEASEYFHYHADSWYTWKASRVGIKVEIHGGAKATNEASNYFDKIGVSISAFQGWKDLFRKGSPIYLQEHWRFSCAILGLYGGMKALTLIPAMMKYTLVCIRRSGVKSLFENPHKHSDLI